MNNTFNENNTESAIIKFMLFISLEGLMRYIINTVDTFMVGGLGETSVAAVGIANQFYNLLSYIFAAVCSSSVIFASQYWGRKDVKSLHKVMGISLIANITAALIFSFSAIAFPKYIIGIFTDNQAVVDLAVPYLRIKGFSYIATVVTACYLAIVKSTGKALLPLILSIVTLVESIFLNYAFIYGKLGFPAMGVYGAAISTCVLRCLECMVLLACVYIKRYSVAAGLKDMLSFDRTFAAQFFKISMPVIITEIAWYLGITTYNWIYARMGVESIAAVNICSSIEGIGTTLFVGMVSTSSILLSNYIGVGSNQKAFECGKKFWRITLAASAIIGLIFIICSKVILSFYLLSPAAYKNTRYLLIITGCVFWIKISNYMVFSGVIRSGGSTRFPMIVELASIWGVGIPMALIGAFVFHLPVYWVMLMAMADEITKLIGATIRFFSRKWIINMVSHSEQIELGGDA